MIEVYRPVLSYLMDRPAALAWILGVTFLLGFAPLGNRPVFLATLFLAMVSTALLARRAGGRGRSRRRACCSSPWRPSRR